MTQPSESVVKEFDYHGQHVTIYQVFGGGFDYVTSGGLCGCCLSSKQEAERVAKAVIDDDRSGWMRAAAGFEREDTR